MGTKVALVIDSDTAERQEILERMHEQQEKHRRHWIETKAEARLFFEEQEQEYLLNHKPSLQKTHRHMICSESINEIRVNDEHGTKIGILPYDVTTMLSERKIPIEEIEIVGYEITSRIWRDDHENCKPVRTLYVSWDGNDLIRNDLPDDLWNEEKDEEEEETGIAYGCKLILSHERLGRMTKKMKAEIDSISSKRK